MRPILTRRAALWFALAPLLRAASGSDWIRALRGRTALDASGEVIAVDLSGTWINDAEMLELLAFPKLERLDLSHTRISDEGLIHLRPARQIVELNLLYAEQISDQGMTAIKDWKMLKRLYVRGTRIGDGTLAIIGELPQLESLDITNTAITENGLEGLIPLTRIRHLAIGQSRLTDTALEVLRFLNTLESLDLSGPKGALRNNQRAGRAQVSPSLVQAIGELTSLRTLKLGHSLIGGDDLAQLGASLPKVEKLGLEGCTRIDDSALEKLARWKSLRFLDVQDTAVTRSGVAKLAQLNPALIVLAAKQ